VHTVFLGGDSRGKKDTVKLGRYIDTWDLFTVSGWGGNLTVPFIHHGNLSGSRGRD